MKKFIAILLAALMVFAFAACKGGSTPTADEEGSTTDTTAATPGADDTTAASSEEADGSDDFGYITDKGTLIVGITEYEPMDYKDENGKWTGFDAEYAEAVAEKLGLKVEFVEIGDWDNKEIDLKSKKVDCIWNGMTITENLKKSMDITNPYVINAQVVVMKADKLENYKDVESMKELTFAVETGSAGASCANDNGLKSKEVDLQSTALLEVESGKSDACIIDITMAKAMTGEGTSYASLGMGLALNEEEYGIGCRLGSDLVGKINAATAELVAEGKMAQLAEKYQLTLAEGITAVEPSSEAA